MAEKKGSSSEKTLYCSFCGKSQHEVKKLIAGPSVFICEECIDLCNEIIRDELPPADPGRLARSDLPTPADIKANLDNYVIGQEVAKRTLAVAVYNHYKRLRYKDKAGKWHNKGKDEVPGELELSERNFKYAVHMSALDAKVPVIPAHALQIVPVGPIPAAKGAPLMIKALYKGQPVGGVQVLTEYVTDPDEIPTVTGADGTTTIRLRNQGLNVVVGILMAPSDNPKKYDRMEERATLSFVLPHLPE